MGSSSLSERGQAIILFVGVFTVILVMAAIVVDFGLWFAERRSAQRGADLAAAAGALDLPLSPGLAFTNACAWAEDNGFDYTDDDDVEVFVSVFERDGFGSDEDCELVGETPPAPPCGSQCDTVRVRVTKGAPRLFTALPFGIDDFEIGAVAAAGITYGGSGGIGGTGPDQTVLLVDAQGRMGKGFGGENCSSVPQSCPIVNERSAARAFVDTLLGLAGNGEVGYAAYNNCYGPTVGPQATCIHDNAPNDAVIEPTRDSAALHVAIDNTVAYQRQAANICTGLWQASELFRNPAVSRQVLVLMSGGDNLDYPTFNESRPPPAGCFPSYPIALGSAPLPCSASRPAESELDYLTLEMARYLKDDLGVEIYVIALNPCRWAADRTLPPVDNPWPADCGQVGNAQHDNIADQRLLMCIATSPEHYQRVNNVAELPNVIEEIASEIVSRSLLQ